MNTYLDDLSKLIRSAVPVNVGIPAEADDLFLMYALVGLVKGARVDARDVHDAWVVWKRTRGEQHQSMVPYDELDPETQAEDLPFVTAILSALRARAGEGAGL